MRASSLAPTRSDANADEPGGPRHASRGEHSPLAPQLSISERPVSKDYRSFAATAFGTVAFKMLEWLTPQGIEHISKTLSDVSHVEPAEKTDEQDTTTVHEAHLSPPRSKRRPSKAPRSDRGAKTANREREPAAPGRTSTQPSEPPAFPTHAPKHKRGSKGSLRAPPSPASNRRGSLDTLNVPPAKDDVKSTAKNAQLNSFHPDKRPRTSKIAPSIITRGVPEIPLKQAFFENVPCLSPPRAVDNVEDVDAAPRGQGDSENNVADVATSPAAGQSGVPPKPNISAAAAEDASWIDYPLPQSLRRLDVEVVDFICDTFQEDRTWEKHFFGPVVANETLPTPQDRKPRLVRRRLPECAVHPAQWKAFNEQTLFDVLSNPRALVQSFTRDGKLYDSQTLWYCMLRMTRVVPSLVLHSLWMAAKSLFVPPESLKGLGPQAGRLFDGRVEPLSNFDAGCVMSVCLHALVAAAPCVMDSKTLYEMSRIRSHGLVLAGSGSTGRQPASMCLEYEDVFSNDLALRLASRLLCAITARRCFADIVDCDSNVRDGGGSLDILGPLLGQLDLLSNEAARILEFTSAERLLHETRVPTLLLDWARAVLLRDWDGRPEFSSNGPFYGALSLMATLCKLSAMPHGWNGNG